MTSQLNLEDIYSELNNLLKDVCSFLTNEAQNGTLSAKAKNEAEKLVSRSRQQVDIVTNLAVLQDNANSYPYLEMQGPPGETLSEYVAAEITDYYEPEHYEESYAPVEEAVSVPPPTSTVNGDYCLYEELPLYMIDEKSVKNGPLCRRERYLFIEQKKQYMAGLVGYWLLIYALNKKDQKPLQILNLLNYSARTLEQRKDPTFEIYADNEKTHEFIARSVKDMEQWVVAINCKKHFCTNGRNLPEIPSTLSSQEIINSDRNNTTPKTSDIHQDVMHYGSDEDIYASVEDLCKIEKPKPLPEQSTEDFPKLPPRSTKEFPAFPEQPTADNTYNNLTKTESEVNNDDDDQSDYDIVQCSELEKQKDNDEEEEFETYNELKVTETINPNVIKPFTNIRQDNYDANVCEEELEDYDTVKPPSKILLKINVPPNNYLVEEEEEEMPDYYELKPTCLPSKLKQTKNETNLPKDEELKPIYLPSKLKQTKNEITLPKDEDLEDYDELKPKPKPKPVIPEKTLKEEKKLEIEEELPDYDILKPTFQNKPTPKNEEQIKSAENNNDTKPAKPVKPIKKFWEKRSSEPPKKEIESDDQESKMSVANLRSKLNAQLLLTPEKSSKPLVTSPKPKTHTLLNKFPSFSKNRNSKDEDGNSRVQNFRQQLENSLRNHK